MNNVLLHAMGVAMTLRGTMENDIAIMESKGENASVLRDYLLKLTSHEADLYREFFELAESKRLAA